MGYALAEALQHLGASVTLLSGPTSLPTPVGVMRIDLEKADELLAHSLQAAADAQIFIGAAAVADYRVDAPAEEKIKKNDTNMSLALSRNPEDRKSTRLNSSHQCATRMPYSA